MGRKRLEVKVHIHMPENEEASRELSRRAGAIHADMALHCIQKLNCPAAQKLKLLDELKKTAQSD